MKIIYILFFQETMTEFVWVSVDPVRRRVDVYPKTITIIEKSYNERDRYAATACVLGSDFFNATVHFTPSELSIKPRLVYHMVEQDLNNQVIEV